MRDCIVGNGHILHLGPNEQNQHFAELRQKVCLHIHAVVQKVFGQVWMANSNVLKQKKWKEGCAKLKSDQRGLFINCHWSDRLYSDVRLRLDLISMWSHKIDRRMNVCLHYRGGVSHACSECTSWVVLVNTWARSRAEVVNYSLGVE